MRAAIVAGLFLWLPLSFPMIVLTRSLVIGVASAPLAFAAICALSGCVAMLTGSSVIYWELLVVATANIVAIGALIRYRRISNFDPLPSWAAGAILLASVIPLVFALNRFAVDWDARVNWFGHARWFFVGGDFARSAVSDGGVWGIVNDYPILIQATVGSMWRVTGRIDLRRAQMLVGVLNACAIFLLGWSLRDLYARRYPTLSIVASSAMCLAVYGLGREFTSNGYADVLWSVSIVGSAVLLLVAPPQRGRTILGSLLLLVAALTKSEGWVSSLLVASIAMWRHRTMVRQHPWILLCIPILSCWSVTARLTDATARYQVSLLEPVVRGDGAVWSRMPSSLTSIFDQAPLLFGAAILATAVPRLVVVLFGTHPGDDDSAAYPRAPWAFMIAAAGVFGFLLVSYMIDPGPLPVLLDTSVYRTTISLRLFALCLVLFASFDAAEVFSGRIFAQRRASSGRAHQIQEGRSWQNEDPVVSASRNHNPPPEPPDEIAPDSMAPFVRELDDSS